MSFPSLPKTSSAKRLPVSTMFFGPYARPSNASANLQLAFTFMDARSSWDLETLFDTMDETAEHRTLPESLGRPMLTKSQFRDYLEHIKHMFLPSISNVLEVIEASDSVVISLSLQGKSALGTDYKTDMMTTVHFMRSSSGDGTLRIGSVTEFVDSVYQRTWFRAEREKERREGGIGGPTVLTPGTSPPRKGPSSRRVVG